MLAGERAGPLRIRISGIRSSSKLVDAAAQGLQFDVDFTPKPLRFLSALTADIVALGGVTGYGATVHVRMTNPLPQLVRVREVDVQARGARSAARSFVRWRHIFGDQLGKLRIASQQTILAVVCVCWLEP